MKKFFILLSIFLLICSFSLASEKTYTLHKIGDTITTNIFKFTLNSVHWDEGNEFDSPDSGKKWLVVDCTVQNLTTEPQLFSTMIMFSLFDVDSYSQDMAFFATTKGSLDGTVAPSQTVRGQVAYEVEENHKSWEFVFTPQAFSSEQYFYSITKEQIK